ncbi:hypothetical protein [Methylocella sp.]|jgi:hypothetical protein
MTIKTLTALLSRSPRPRGSELLLGFTLLIVGAACWLTLIW